MKEIRPISFLVSLLVAVVFMSSCSTSKTVRGNEGYKSSATQKTVAAKDSKLVKEAKSWLGTKYKYGGCSKDGTDCSGFVMQVYLKVYDIKLPRTSKQQHEYCKAIKKTQLKVGDLVFFATGKNRNTVSHVGLYIGNNEFIHASSSKGVVVSRLDQNYYLRTYVSGGRVEAVKRK